MLNSNHVLNYFHIIISIGDIDFSSGYVTIEVKIGLRFCQNSGTPVNNVNFTCICHYGFTGNRCERYIGNLKLYLRYDYI